MVCLLDNPFNRQCFMEDKIMGCSINGLSVIDQSIAFIWKKIQQTSLQKNIMEKKKKLFKLSYLYKFFELCSTRTLSIDGKIEARDHSKSTQRRKS